MERVDNGSSHHSVTSSLTPPRSVHMPLGGGGGRKHLEKLGIQNLESRSLKLPYEVSIVIDAFIPVINGVV